MRDNVLATLNTTLGSIEIASAKSSDLQVVLSILNDAVKWLSSQNIQTWNPALLPDVMQPAIERGEVYLAYHADQPIATVTLQWEDVAYWGERPNDAGYLHKLVVSRAAAGHHIGELLVDWVESVVKAQNRPYVRLDCDAENPAINQFYQRLGYSYRGIIDNGRLKLNLYEKSIRSE